MSSGLKIDQNCTSLAIPRLYTDFKNPQEVIHKLDSMPVNSPTTRLWKCFWYQGIDQNNQQTIRGDGPCLNHTSGAYLKNPIEGSCSIPRGMRIDTYC
jgi:hypothetical protein